MYPYPFGNQPMNMTQSVTPVNNYPRLRIPRVSGFDGANAYPLYGPNQEIFLLDDTAPRIWLKTTDEYGLPKKLIHFKIVMESDSNPDNSTENHYNDLEKRIASLEAMMSEQSNTRTAESESISRTTRTS